MPVTGTIARQVAEVTRAQIGVWALASVGAHKLAYAVHQDCPAFTFLARLSFKGQTRVRITRVFVVLTWRDTYDVVCEVGGVERYRVEDVYADALPGVVMRLDSEGI